MQAPDTGPGQARDTARDTAPDMGPGHGPRTRAPDPGPSPLAGTLTENRTPKKRQNIDFLMSLCKNKRTAAQLRSIWWQFRAVISYMRSNRAKRVFFRLRTLDMFFIVFL